MTLSERVQMELVLEGLCRELPHRGPEITRRTFGAAERLSYALGELRATALQALVPVTSTQI